MLCVEGIWEIPCKYERKIPSPPKRLTGIVRWTSRSTTDFHLTENDEARRARGNKIICKNENENKNAKLETGPTNHMRGGAPRTQRPACTLHCVHAGWEKGGRGI
jgi:hypothetical protein